MALNNIFREPKRELIEQFVGVLILLCILWLWYLCYTALDIAFECSEFSKGPCKFISGCLSVGILIVIWLAILIAHSIGQGICNVLAKGGIELRPKRRY